MRGAPTSPPEAPLIKKGAFLCRESAFHTIVSFQKISLLDFATGVTLLAAGGSGSLLLSRIFLFEIFVEVLVATDAVVMQGFCMVLTLLSAFELLLTLFDLGGLSGDFVALDAALDVVAHCQLQGFAIGIVVALAAADVVIFSVLFVGKWCRVVRVLGVLFGFHVECIFNGGSSPEKTYCCKRNNQCSQQSCNSGLIHFFPFLAQSMTDPLRANLCLAGFGTAVPVSIVIPLKSPHMEM